MDTYSRSLPHQARTADQLDILIRHYPNGVTVKKLLSDNSEFIKDPNSILAALNLLEKEGKIKQEKQLAMMTI